MSIGQSSKNNVVSYRMGDGKTVGLNIVTDKTARDIAGRAKPMSYSAECKGGNLVISFIEQSGNETVEMVDTYQKTVKGFVVSTKTTTTVENDQKKSTSVVTKNPERLKCTKL